MPIPPGSLWGRVVRGGGLSLCPTKKSPFGDMNLNKVGVKGGGTTRGGGSRCMLLLLQYVCVSACLSVFVCVCLCVCVCVTDGELWSADRPCMLPGCQIIFGNL